MESESKWCVDCVWKFNIEKGICRECKEIEPTNFYSKYDVNQSGQGIKNYERV